ncbi:protein-glutamine glutaminase family protein [Ferruginibacter sp. SUN002]|uniref:protein-glutamine glutaminase family protein n=1 Tax=Ferruginibacter sp. SUN002 TaxID=2937789 RepID=UPI003D35EE0F
MTMITIYPTLFDDSLSDITPPYNTVSEKQAEKLFTYFKEHPLFNWKNSHNGCEGKADAVCVLLDEWGIPNYKAWVFGGAYLRKNYVGELMKYWNYHVAAVLAVEKDGKIIQYVLDPATADTLQTVEDWAAGITYISHSYHCTRQAHWYIFSGKSIINEKWNKRNRRNRKWMIQCLAGINSLTIVGKAQLCFKKTQIKKTLLAFREAKKNKPDLND